MTDEELEAGTAAGRILLGGGSGIRLIRAKIVRPKKLRTCPTCDQELPVGEPCWMEQWVDDDQGRSTEYLHLQCDIEGEEPRLEYRNNCVHHYGEEVGKLKWDDEAA